VTTPSVAGDGGARRGFSAARRLVWGAALALSFVAGAAAQDATRGAYLAAVAGCRGCHTTSGEGATAYAGGRELKTPFGSLYGPNITPDPVHGIGRWSEGDLRRALREGLRPDGANYFPAFPYTSFTGMSDADIRDLWAFLRTIPPAATPSRPHALGFPYSIRLLVTGWKLLYFTQGPHPPTPGRPPQLARGAYIVESLAHCGECHTPRNSLGALQRSQWLAGNRNFPGGGKVPNITPDPATGIGRWSEGELRELLGSGMTRDGDFVGGEMAEVVRDGTSKLTPDDMNAMLAYLRALAPVVHDVRAAP